MASVTTSNGSTCLLWEDCWQGPPWKLSFPELYSYAKKPNISLAAAVSIFPSSDLLVSTCSELTSKLSDQCR